MESPESRPTVKLRPGKGRRLRNGAPWAYADEIAMDRRTKALPPGTLVRLMEGDRPLGIAAFNPASQIAARLLDPNPDIATGPWLAERLARAATLRRELFGAEASFCRLVHAEGDGLPGLVIDRYGDAAVIQPNASWADRHMDDIVAALDAVMDDMAPIRTLVINGQSRVRSLEGLEQRLDILRGEVVAPVPVEMNGALYLADLTGGQKTGLFYDQRETHAAAARLSHANPAMLDIFAHVGGFGLARLAAVPAPAHVVAVDSSAPALALAEEAARRMGVADRYETRRADAGDAMAAAASVGERYGTVVCDPPAFAPHKGALDAGLRAYEKVARRSAALVDSEGWLVLCSCSGAVSPEAFREASARGIRAAGRSAALVRSGRAGPDHPQHMALPETGYLKALVFRMQP